MSSFEEQDLCVWRGDGESRIIAQDTNELIYKTETDS